MSEFSARYRTNAVGTSGSKAVLIDLRTPGGKKT